LALAPPVLEGALRHHQIGAFTGVASLLYSWTLAGDFLDAPELYAAAERVSGVLTPDRVAADRAYDVISGAAGAILALLRLHARTGADRLLDLVDACGRLLVRRASRSPDGTACWRRPGFEALSGMSHGAAGIALALMRAWIAVGNESFRDVARAGLRFERSRFDPVTRNLA
jgi:class II lanthipeptide synthase